MPQPSRQHNKQITLIMKNNHLKIAVNKESKMPTVKKIIPYKLKKLGSIAMLGAASLLALNSCGKDDEPEDPTKAKIEALKAQEKQQAAEVRAAVEPATTQPDNIENWYWGVFDYNNLPRGINLYDSTKVHIKVIDAAFEVFKTTTPHNVETLSSLYNKSKTYIATVDELRQLQK
jgi:hypothetical protein